MPSRNDHEPSKYIPSGNEKELHRGVHQLVCDEIVIFESSSLLNPAYETEQLLLYEGSSGGTASEPIVLKQSMSAPSGYIINKTLLQSGHVH